jgi:hypothetical protein
MYGMRWRSENRPADYTVVVQMLLLLNKNKLNNYHKDPTRMTACGLDMAWARMYVQEDLGAHMLLATPRLLWARSIVTEVYPCR